MKNYKHKRIPVGDLKPYRKNARKHTQEQIDQLSRAISEFGFTNPLLVDEKNNVIAGHGRLIAAIGLGINAVPCIVIDGLSTAQRKALIVADNKLALNAYWDNELLYSELKSLGDSFELTGFSENELKALIVDDEFELDDEPDSPDKPRRKTDDDASAFEFVLAHDQKLKLVSCLNTIKDDQRIETNADALMYLVDFYAGN